MQRIVVLVRKKKTDALICRALAHHASLTVIRYGVPHMQWHRWIMKRIKTAGFFVLLGHLALSIFLKCARAFEKISSKTIWEKHGAIHPVWKDIPVTTCHSLKSLQENIHEPDMIIALDAFRLPQSFFHALTVPYYEVVWSDATKYLGDSGAFWGYVAGDVHAANISIIKRSAYFHTVHVVANIPVVISNQESLRSLKVKQAMALAEYLPTLLTKLSNSDITHDVSTERVHTVAQCYAPTLWTYARFIFYGLSKLPRYACQYKDITVRVYE